MYLWENTIQTDLKRNWKTFILIAKIYSSNLIKKLSNMLYNDKIDDKGKTVIVYVQTLWPIKEIGTIE